MAFDEEAISKIMPELGTTKCAGCVGDYIKVADDIKNDVLYDGEEPTLPRVEDAITWLPSWQTMQMGMQTVVACVALPSCVRHAQTKEETPVERATRSGLALGGPNGMP